MDKFITTLFVIAAVAVAVIASVGGANKDMKRTERIIQLQEDIEFLDKKAHEATTMHCPTLANKLCKQKEAKENELKKLLGI